MVILSCHNEFDFARQALQLDVKEYLLKDTLNPQDLTAVLLTFKASLDTEAARNRQEVELRRLADRSKEGWKETFIRRTVHNPIVSRKEWFEEAASFGLELQIMPYIPVFCSISHYCYAKKSFASEDTLIFAVQNVLNEVLRENCPNAVSFHYRAAESFLLFPVSNWKRKGNADFRCLRGHMQQIETAVDKALGLPMAFLAGTICMEAEQLQQELIGLLNSTGQRFYLETAGTMEQGNVPVASDDLFFWYDEAAGQMRKVILSGNPGGIKPTVAKWLDFIKKQQFPPQMVKDWVLKLLLDLKMKLRTMQFFFSTASAEALHREILEIRSASELERWLMEYLTSLQSSAGKGTSQPPRKEVLEACRYVSMNLEKKITLDDVSKSLYLNPSYFSRMFKKEVGETFVEYVTKRKMERAKELLDQTAEPVGKICEMLGYENQSYFIKIFKGHAGVTPLDYRGNRNGARHSAAR
nr:helix-turn-helix domain-containing protein [Evansella caseinilytica]